MLQHSFECPLLQGMYSEQNYARIAWASWLWNLTHWDWFVTFTYASDNSNRRGPGIPTARSTMSRYGALFPAMGGGIAAVLERGELNGRLHWHALIQERERILPDWLHGYAKWEIVRSERASYYISKYLVKDALDIIIQLPDRLRDCGIMWGSIGVT
jgi:hypothetical protein